MIDIRTKSDLGFRAKAMVSVLPLALLAMASPALAQSGPEVAGGATAFGDAGKVCRSLEDIKHLDLSSSFNQITQIVSAKPVKGEGDVPDYCEVSGFTWPQNEFLLRFPLVAWNGKLVVNGGAGQDGAVRASDPRSKHHREYSQASPLANHWATLDGNGGHFSSLTDGKWGYYNPQQLIDFAMRSTHSITVASKAVLKKYAGFPAKYTFFEGCSNGGREAMISAQRYPDDFDGIIAGAPSINVRNIFVNLYWQKELLTDQSRQGFDMTAAKLLHATVIAQCDKLDGVKDGLIANPFQCKVDMKPILCKAGPADNCLTEHQADIARKIYEGPRDSNGQQIVPSSAFPGSEISWVTFITPGWVSRYPEDIMRFEMMMPAPGPEWWPKPEDLASYIPHMDTMQALTGALNPDLRAFKAHGGKIISFIGLTDSAGGVEDLIDYYGLTERTMGGAKTTLDFYRTFLIPGMDHCGGGEGASDFKFLDELDAWVEKGKAPETITGTHPGPDGTPAFSKTWSYYVPGGKS